MKCYSETENYCILRQCEGALTILSIHDQALSYFARVSVIVLSSLILSTLITSLTQAAQLPQNVYLLPDDGQPKNNHPIGPFCCTGSTVTVVDADGNPVGYIYYADFDESHTIGGTTCAKRFTILVSARAQMSDPYGPQERSRIDFIADRMKSGATGRTRAGSFIFTAVLQRATLRRLNIGRGGLFYELGTPKVTVMVHDTRYPLCARCRTAPAQSLRPAARNSRAIEVEVGVLGVWVLRAGFSQSLGEHPSNSLSICYNACPKELQAVELPSDAFCAQRGEHR